MKDVDGIVSMQLKRPGLRQGGREEGRKGRHRQGVQGDLVGKENGRYYGVRKERRRRMEGDEREGCWQRVCERERE